MRACLLTVAAMLAGAVVQSAEPPKPAAEKGQIAFEVRTVEVRDNFFERVGIDIKPDGTLTDRQVRTLLEAIQVDPTGKVLQCPKITADDGQESTVRITDRQVFTTGIEATRVNGAVTMVPKTTPVETGVTMTIRGQADGKTVATRVSYQDVRVATPVETIPVVATVGGVPTTYHMQVPQTKTFAIDKRELAIPSGGHAILSGPTRAEENRYEFGPPIVSQIPYLNRLFRNVGVDRQTVQTYLIVSPKVLPAEKP